MKTILKTYGGTVIAMSVMSVVLLYMVGLKHGKFPQGNKMVELVEVSIDSSSSYVQLGEAFDEHKERRRPQITYYDDYEVKTNTYIPLTDCVKAVNYEGEELKIEVTDIIGCNEEQLTTFQVDGEDCFYFEAPGIYQVYIRAVDEEGLYTYVMIKVPVNKGGEL